MLPLDLSMLWESADPGDALRERFGFDGLGAATAWVGDALERTWALSVFSCPRLVISDQNAIIWVSTDRGDLVLKWSRAQERFPALESSTRVLHHVAEHGVPVAAPLPAQDGRVRVTLDGPLGPLSAAVLPEVTGHWLDVADLDAVRSAGSTLAALHTALRSVGHLPDAGAPSRPAQSGDPAQGPGHWLAVVDRGLAPEDSRRLARMLAGAPPLEREQQLVHHDYRAANILVRDSAVVGVLDFDGIEPAHRVDDLARASVYLATRFTGWGPTPRPARAALREGYESVQPLSADEVHWLEILTLWYGLTAIPDGAGMEAWVAAL
ncbi:phosphotransferase enzyme family protein [Brachybacterium sacelli]|uniref:Hydroxylysine kinase n=1 Tax=Brachybacterium sacelli TaxID=173364 RepID=A0ABS4X5T4_9MICO|nr:phosphotransferase [Brachybacterium sacelli]MBP2383603.1 Ser/Thr protein kinase RdoA (MazF antagonist) [Brachybacterium sacelli]